MAEKTKVVTYRNNRTGQTFTVQQGSIVERRTIGKLAAQQTDDGKPVMEQLGKPREVEALSRREQQRRRREHEQAGGQPGEDAGANTGAGQGG